MVHLEMRKLGAYAMDVNLPVFKVIHKHWLRENRIKHYIRQHSNKDCIYLEFIHNADALAFKLKFLLI